MALCPFLEANQGAISVGALVLALSLALWEQRQASLQRLKENREEIQDAITLIEALEDAILSDGDDSLDDIELDENAVEAVRTIAGALRALAAAHAKTPLLALALIRAAQAAGELAELDWEHDPDEARGEAGRLLEGLAEAKSDAEDALERTRRRAFDRKLQKRRVRKLIRRFVRDYQEGKVNLRGEGADKRS